MRHRLEGLNLHLSFRRLDFDQHAVGGEYENRAGAKNRQHQADRQAQPKPRPERAEGRGPGSGRAQGNRRFFFFVCGYFRRPGIPGTRQVVHPELQRIPGYGIEGYFDSCDRKPVPFLKQFGAADRLAVQLQAGDSRGALHQGALVEKIDAGGRRGACRTRKADMRTWPAAQQNRQLIRR